MQWHFFYIAWLCGAYVIGSVSSGALIAKLSGLEIGSLGDGNPGARNVWREIGHKRGLIVFAIDFATGVVVALPLFWLGAPIGMRLLVVAAVMAGHFFPAFWRFQGGTGGAVSMGAAFGLLPFEGLIAAPVALAILGFTRTTIYAMWAFFGVTLLSGALLHEPPMALVAVFFAGMIPVVKWATHHRIRSISDVRKLMQK